MSHPLSNKFLFAKDGNHYRKILSLKYRVVEPVPLNLSLNSPMYIKMGNILEEEPRKFT